MRLGFPGQDCTCGHRRLELVTGLRLGWLGRFEYSACYTPPPIPIRRRWPRSPLGLLWGQTCSMHSMLVHYPLRGSFPALRFCPLDDADEAQRNQSLGLPTLRTDFLIGRQAPGATVMSPPQAIRPAALVGRVSLASRRSFSGPCRAVWFRGIQCPDTTS